MEVHSEKDIEQLRKSEKIKEAGFVVNGEPDMRDPCAIIRGVESNFEDKDVKESIWRKNKDLFEEWKFVEWEKEFRVRGKVGPRSGRSVAWVVQLSPRLYKRVLWLGRLYVGLQSCRVGEYVEVTRCFKCGLGHVSRFCGRLVTCVRYVVRKVTM